jgi:hypothetical protein
VELFRLYEATEASADEEPRLFEVTSTANVVLKARKSESYSFFFGHDYTSDGARSLEVSPVHAVREIGDLEGLRTLFDADDFQGAFEGIFGPGGSDVYVHSIASVIFIIRTSLEDFESDRRTTPRQNALSIY